MLTMTTGPESTQRAAARFDDDETRWQAVVDRDPTADGLFWYSVRTTGVFCRPTCPARRARRTNVRFHPTCQDAELAGFRPCRRCAPTGASLSQRHAAAITRVCRLIEAANEVPSLDDLARAVEMSGSHLHRVFKEQTGLTPRAYAVAHQSRRIRQELTRRPTVTQAIHSAGFSSSGRFYESSNDRLGMTPQTFRAGGSGAVIHFAIGESWLGPILVATSDRGVCAILIGDDPDELARDLQDRFPNAQLEGGDAAFELLVAQVVGFVERPTLGLDLPLDIRGTAFQQRVWAALRQIPAGSTATYAEIAARIGQPSAVRAVAQACATNALAVVIPCHRVVRTDGSLSGYRWGVARKARLLDRERGAG